MITPLTHTKAGSADSNSVVTPPIDTTSADFLVLDLAYNTTLPAVADSKGNVWAPLAEAAIGANRSRRYICVPTHVGSGHTFSAIGSSCFPALCVHAFSGVAQVDPVEQHTTVLGGALTPLTGGALVVAGLAVISTTAGVVATAISGGFTLADAVPFPSGTNLGAALGYMIQSAPVAVNPVFTMSASSTLMGTMTIFKSATAAPAAPPSSGSLVQLFINGALAFTTIACGGVTAPTAIDKAPVGLPIVISGQSNAYNLQYPLAFPALYPSAVFAGALPNMEIAQWLPGTTLWTQLDAALHQPLTAVVWWQGETDYNLPNQNYAADLRSLIARIRSANNNAKLLIVIVQILPYANNGWLRDMQASVAAADPYTVLVKMDGIPTDGGVHLVWLAGLDNGYVAGTQRILAAIQSRQ